MLPTKTTLENWDCNCVVERLMYENKWPRKLAKQWFTDFMRWLYSSQRWKQEKSTAFFMDVCHYLDDVWHAYILHTKEYFRMSKVLFGVEYLHHNPEPAFFRKPIEKETYREQLIFLLDDWGEEYIDRVWSYGADIFDITNNDDLNRIAT